MLEGELTPQTETPVEEENDGLFGEDKDPEEIENFAQKANTLCVTIAKAGLDGYAVIENIAGDSDPKKIIDNGIQVTVLMALNSMVEDPKAKVEIPAEQPTGQSDAPGYLDELNGLIGKIEAAGGEWQPTLKGFTGSDVPNEEISTPTKQNVLRSLEAELNDLKESKEA